MNEPQAWTMIIGTLAVFFTLVGLISTWFVRLINAQFEAMTARFDAIGARFDALETTIDARFAAVDARFETVDVKLTHLDRDVQALTKHVFRQPE